VKRPKKQPFSVQKWAIRKNVFLTFKILIQLLIELKI